MYFVYFSYLSHILDVCAESVLKLVYFSKKMFWEVMGGGIVWAATPGFKQARSAKGL